MLPAAPGAHRPFNGAGPGGEGTLPLPCQVVSPGGGAAAGGGGGRGADHVLPGVGGDGAWSGPRGRGGAASGMGHPWELSVETRFRLFSKCSGVFANAAWRFPLGGLARTVTSPRLPSGSWNL